MAPKASKVKKSSVKKKPAVKAATKGKKAAKYAA